MYCKREFYGFFNALFSLGLKGLEQGYNYGSVETSGEKHVIELLKKNYIKPVIIDGGANNGQYAKMCLEILGSTHLHCFEPAEKNFEILKSNLSKFDDIRFIKLALSDKCQKLVLNHYTNNPAMASVVISNFDDLGLDIIEKEEIEAVTIDYYCSVNNIKKIDLLKLDLEGYEFFALEGAVEMINNNKIDMIQFEMGRANIDSKTFFKDFYNYLKEKYRFYRILSYGFISITNYSYNYEVFLGNNYLAVHKNCQFKIIE